jgi:putative ABC transport system permease protein
MILLTPSDLAIAASLILLLALLSWRQQLGLEKQLIIGALRTTVQLLLIGMVLKLLFEQADIGWIAALSTVMLVVAGYEVGRRQKHRFSGLWGYGLGTLSMFISAFTLTFLTLQLIIQADPWYQPQYAIPLLGMMLGNTMTGIALSLDQITRQAKQQRRIIEARLALGHTSQQAIQLLRQESMRVGMTPMINAMAAAGIISLPGMMTGQILAGAPPLEAVKYQILIMFLITAGTGLGTIIAISLASKRLFDDRHRLRLERLN